MVRESHGFFGNAFYFFYIVRRPAGWSAGAFEKKKIKKSKPRAKLLQYTGEEQK
ncbi:MAG: hypothetical protein HFI88_11560 [Lachnospiraceae bacterium]|nr:hypothetical protein [Lachnospiraceae bacterium]